MNNLVNIFEGLLNENPNQAARFLKDKNLDPATNPKGKKILDDVLSFTRGDGYTFMFTKFLANEHKPILELEVLYRYLKNNKEYLQRLPQSVLTYETSRKLLDDIARLENERELTRFLKQLSPELREQFQLLSSREKLDFQNQTLRFKNLKPEKQRHWMKKVFGFKDINVLIENLTEYIKATENEQDYLSLLEKIDSTDGAAIAYKDDEREIVIAHIQTFEASKILGCTSAWCIAKDIARFRQYKSGGKPYFFIWDFEYPPTNSNFFIGTAYNQDYPRTSQTFEHIYDNRVNLNDIFESKELSFDILDKYIEEYKKSYSQSQEATSNIAKALQNNDMDTLIGLINDSSYLQEIGADPRVNWNRTSIDLNVKEDDLIELLDLGEEFKYISSMAEYNQNDYYDNDESNYMHNNLNDENIILLKEIAQLIGADENLDFTKEGKIADFLEKYDMESVIETYASELSDAMSRAEQNRAKELVQLVPFDVNKTTFDTSTLFDYYTEHDLTATTFDELIDQIREHLPSIGYDDISEARYVDLDVDELNQRVKSDLEEIIDDINNDEDNPYYIRAKAMKDSKDYLRKLGLKKYGDKIGVIESGETKIVIDDVGGRIEDDETFTVIINATVYRKNKEPQKIRVPLTSIKKYIDQPQLPLQETLKLMSIAKLIIK